LMMVMVMVPAGSMEHVLIKLQQLPVNLSVDKKTTLKNICTILQMAVDASAGILHMHSKGVIHCDIASRNFLVDDQHRVVVCDLGMSRILPPGQTTTKGELVEAIPVAWSAPETLIRSEYSEKTDVYSFGVFLSELFMRDYPYPAVYDGKMDLELIAAEVLKQKRPVLPWHTPKEMSALIGQCLVEEPQQRPAFEYINQQLASLHHSFCHASDLYQVFHPITVAP